MVVNFVRVMMFPLKWFSSIMKDGRNDFMAPIQNSVEERERALQNIID